MYLILTGMKSAGLGAPRRPVKAGSVAAITPGLHIDLPKTGPVKGGSVADITPGVAMNWPVSAPVKDGSVAVISP